MVGCFVLKLFIPRFIDSSPHPPGFDDDDRNLAQDPGIVSGRFPYSIPRSLRPLH